MAATPFAIDLSQSAVRVLELETGPEDLCRPGEAGASEGAISGGRVLDQEAAAEAIRRAAATAGVKGRSALVAVGDVCTSVHLAPEADLEAAVRAARRDVALPSDRLGIVSSALSGEPAEALVVAFDLAAVEAAVGAVRLAGYEAIAVEARAFAVARAAGAETCLLLEVGPERAEAHLVRRRVPLFSYSFELRSEDGEAMGRGLARDIRRGLAFNRRERGAAENEGNGAELPILVGDPLGLLSSEAWQALRDTVRDAVWLTPRPEEIPEPSPYLGYLACLGLLRRPPSGRMRRVGARGPRVPDFDLLRGSSGAGGAGGRSLGRVFKRRPE